MPFDLIMRSKANHPVGGTIDGRRIRARLLPADSGWVLTLAPKRLLGMGVAIGDDVTGVELVPEGPQRGDLADDTLRSWRPALRLAAFFDTLAQFYRRVLTRWIDATSRLPDTCRPHR